MELPNITFRLGGIDFEITSKEYLIGNQGQCLFGFMGVDIPDSLWIIGDIFIKKYYTIFDYQNKKIGLGKKK